MKPAPIPIEVASSLLRALGLLIGQAGIYGPSHNVTQNAARIVFPEIEQAVGKHGAIEITLREKKLLVNGMDLEASGSGKNLLDRMALHKVEGIAFLAPANMDEFLKCITLFGTAPTTLAADGGFENAMKQANLRSVQVVNVTYRRVSKDQANATTAQPGTERPDKPLRTTRRPNETAAAVLDLTPLPEDISDSPSSTTPSDPFFTDSVPRSASVEARQQQTAVVRQQRASTLASMLRQAATILEQETAGENQNQPAAIEGTVSQIRDMLTTMTTDSERQIQTFAGQVNADRQAVADIESAARRRGVGLQLTRGELISHYSEISQEIAQPLTGLERLGRRREAADQLPVLAGGAARVVQVDGAQVARQLEGAAPGDVGRLVRAFAPLRQREEQREGDNADD